MDLKSEIYLKLLRKIDGKTDVSQRELSNSIGVSLGKINYCIKALKTKGLIKIRNFKKSEDKLKYLYVLTPKGIEEKTKITVRFMKLKMKEYDELHSELNRDR